MIKAVVKGRIRPQLSPATQGVDLRQGEDIYPHIKDWQRIESINIYYVAPTDWDKSWRGRFKKWLRMKLGAEH